MTFLLKLTLQKVKKVHYVGLLLFILTSCVNMEPAIEEFNLAKVALRAAEESEAKRYAPNVFSEANRNFKMGEASFKDRSYQKSAEYFEKSRYYSEKAENISRLKMFKQGDAVQ